MKIGIIAAMQVEINLLLENSEILSEETIHGRTIYHSKLNGHDLYMGVSGIGLANAASFTQLLIDKYSIDTVINTGIAGAIEDGLGTMSVVLADKIYYHDIQARIIARTYPFMDSFPVNENLLIIADESIPTETRKRIGVIASGNAFIDSSSEKTRIKNTTGALACDMESAAIAQIAAGAEVKCLIIRTISDEADEQANETYENFEESAANLSVEILLGILQKI